MIDPERVLVPLVGRPREAEAIEYSLETFPDAELTVLAVIAPIDSTMSEGGVLDRDEERRDAERDRARSLVRSTTADPDAVRIVVEDGRPGTVVPRYATETDAEHVVMRGHDDTRGLVRRLLGRGVATTVFERTSVPVTVLE